MASSAQGRFAPAPSFVSSLKDALQGRLAAIEAESTCSADDAGGLFPHASEDTDDRPCVLVTNDNGINCAGLRALVRSLRNGGFCNAYVCVPQSENTQFGTSNAKQKIVEVCHTNVEGATAFEVSGPTADCVSLGLSGVLFSKKPSLVICGVSRGSTCGFQIFSSALVAGARQALMCGVPSIVLSLDWKDMESHEDDFVSAVDSCLPLIQSALLGSSNEKFPSESILNINLPTSFSHLKGFRITKQGTSRREINWQAIASPKWALGTGLCKQNALGVRVAELGLAASAVAAARKANSPLKNVEIESVAGSVNGPYGSISRRKHHFQMQVAEMVRDGDDVSDDFGALQAGFVSVTPLGPTNNTDEVLLERVADWVADSLQLDRSLLL